MKTYKEMNKKEKRKFGKDSKYVKENKLTHFHEYNNMPTPMSIIIALNDIKGTIVKKGDVVLCLGEIHNMRGHIAFVDANGKVNWGYHPENFRKAEEDET